MGFSARLNTWLDRLQWSPRKRPRRWADLTGQHYNTATRWLTANPALTVAEIVAAVQAVDPEVSPELVAWLAIDGLPPPWQSTGANDCWRALWDAARRLGAFDALPGTEAQRLALLLREGVGQALPLDMLAASLIQAAVKVPPADL